MSLVQLQEILREILGLLDQQVEAITARDWNNLNEDQKTAYQQRKSRILELRAALKDLEKLQ